MFNSIQFNSIKALIVLLIISLSSCEKHTEEILSDAKISESKQGNQIAAPSFEGVQLETIATSKNARGEERRFLSFKTVADFEKAMASLSSENLEQWEKYFGFESARKAKDSETLTEEGIEDEHLAAVLSPENIIQIGKWAFRIDLLNERVAVVEADSKEKVARLFDINHKTRIDENFMWFSTNDDILADLEAGSKGTITKGDKAEVWGWFCKDRYANRKKDEKLHYYGGSIFRLSNKAVYQPVGIYFSLLMKSQMEWKDILGWKNTNPNNSELESSFSYKYSVRCGSSGAASDSYREDTFVYRTNLPHRVYEGVKALEKYEANATFYVKYYDHSSKTWKISASLPVSIKDGY